MNLQSIFNTPYPIIGVVHLLPLPTSARWAGNLQTVIDRAEQEATALAAGGVDGIIVENFFDAPFAKDRVDPATISAMTLVLDRVMSLITIPVGLNVLRNDARSALAIASCLNCPFIRVNVLTGVMATDQGIIEGQAYELMRYRRELGTNTAILADVMVKHARPVGMPDLRTAVKDTIERGLADAIILSGATTGHPPSYEELEISREVAPDTPILLGSGSTCDNISQLLKIADGSIVASSLKRNGNINESIDPIRVAQFVETARQAITHKP